MVGMEIKLQQRLNAAAFRLAGKIGACNQSDTIVIAGSPRSGTTLIQEALQKLPGYKGLNEPLLKRHIQKRHGFTSRPYLTQETATPQQQAFLSDSLTGDLGIDARWAFPETGKTSSLAYHATHRKLLVKFCRINRSLPWFCNRFQTKGTIFVVRHPCSVINSMLRFGQWDKQFVGGHDDPDSPLHLGHLPQQTRDRFGPIVSSLRNETEALTAIWALDHYLPLVQSETHPWILLSYEKLVRDGVKELRRVCQGLGVEVTDQMESTLAQPSSSDKGNLELDTSKQLSKWKHQLTATQLDDIFSVIERAGLSQFFSRDIDPNYDELAKCQSPLNQPYGTADLQTLSA